MVAAGAAGHPEAMDTHMTHIPEIRRLERSRTDRKLAGVCVVLTLLGGAGILIYAAAALVMPDEGKDDSVATAALRERRDRPWPLIGLGLLAVAAAILLSRITLWPNGDSWFLFLVAGAVILWITRQRAADPGRDAAALAAEDSRRVRRVAAVVAITLATLFALVLIAAAAVAAAFDVHAGHGVGERSYAVTNVQELRDEYRLGVGSLKLDFAALQLPPGETHVGARVDIGELRVTVPAGVGLKVRGTAELGEVDLPGPAYADGHNVAGDLVLPAARTLVLDADVGLGSVKVQRAVR
jgi:phage shock protein PspC (stress-responsive transcriptional regulator)